MKAMKADIKEREKITTYFILGTLELRKSKNQQQFLSVSLSDRTGSIRGYLWKGAEAAAATLKENSLVKVRGLAKKVGDSLTIEIERIREAMKDEVDMQDLLEIVQGGVELWQGKLTETIRSIKGKECRRLIDTFLSDAGFYEQFIKAPGGVTVHHNYVGGLLEHTVSTMSLASLTADRYPLLDKDLLMTGAFLHDIGKTKELFYDMARDYTTEGKLLGHILLGISMIEERISRLQNFPEDIALDLKHMIISHHGEPDFGSPVRPATPEALALHMIDNADAKLNHLNCHLKNSNEADLWSHFDRFLKTAIYQGKREGNQTDNEDIAA